MKAAERWQGQSGRHDDGTSAVCFGEFVNGDITARSVAERHER